MSKEDLCSSLRWIEPLHSKIIIIKMITCDDENGKMACVLFLVNVDDLDGTG